MIRVFIAFVVVVGLLHFGIEAWRQLTGKERWKFIKTFSYSVGLGVVAIAIMSAIVILF